MKDIASLSCSKIVLVLQHHDINTRTQFDNLIPEMAAACRWGVELGKLMYPSIFKHIATGVYMSYRPNAHLVHEAREVMLNAAYHQH